VDREFFSQLKGTMAVSCQADANSPLASPVHIVALAKAVVLGGASAVRIEGAENIACVRLAISVPIIGLVKRKAASTEVYITPEIFDVEEAASSGADIVAFDATARERQCGVPDLIYAIHGAGKLAMADVSTVEEGSAAFHAGADIISTTMAGYTKESMEMDGPDFTLMRELAARRIPFAAEGRIWTLEDSQKCFDLGSRFIVVGSAITRPDAITKRFVQHISEMQEVFASKDRASR
jgi:N-acylglucosamine-6-phosphate 2-epimerase